MKNYSATLDLSIPTKIRIVQGMVFTVRLSGNEMDFEEEDFEEEDKKNFVL